MYNLKTIEENCLLLHPRIDSNKLRNSTVLITGANGLIGSFLADYLCFLNERYDYQINIHLTSFSSSEKADRIRHLLKKEKVRYFPWDASREIDVSLLPKKMDYIFFCSGYGQPAKFTKDIVKTSFINTVGVNSLLSYLETTDKKSGFLFISTSEVYGDPGEDNIPTKESYDGSFCLLNSRASYVLSKKLGEVICNSYADRIKIKIARVGLMYGPGTLLNDNRVLQEFIFKAAKSKIIKLMDEGDSLRNYLYLVDGIEMMLNLILNSKTNETTYNIGGDTEPITIFELAKKIGSAFQCEVVRGETNSFHAGLGAPRNVYMDMGKYRSEFSTNNQILLDSGIQSVINWYNF